MSLNIKLSFICCALLYIGLTLVEPYPLSWLVKIVPIVLLLLVLINQTPAHIPKVLLLGLVCSALGDMILGYDAERGFIFGLAAFFLAHICYIASMCPLRWQRTPAIALYLLFAAVLLGLLLPFLGSLLIPVLAYMSILLVMAIATLTSHKSNLWLIIGGLSFVCSDSLLGLDKFYQPIRYAPILIMTSYYLAQFALILGFIHYAQAQLNPAQTSNRQLES